MISAAYAPMFWLQLASFIKPITLSEAKQTLIYLMKPNILFPKIKIQKKNNNETPNAIITIQF